MNVTREDLAAYADGELDVGRAAEVAAAIEADAALAEQLRAHRALRERLSAHFAPILAAPVPERLTAPLCPKPEVIDFAAARERHTRTLPHWSWIAAPALAASLALAVFLPRGNSDEYAGGALAATLDGQLVATQDRAAPTRILVSFQDQAGTYCRAFTGEVQSGVACRDDQGWRLVMHGKGAPGQTGDYRMAGASAEEVLERAQAMAAGPALDVAGEQAAKASGWR